MKVETKCMTCYFAAREPNPDPSHVIMGKVPSMCLRSPPSAMLVQTRDNAMASVSVYPMINPASISCYEYRPDTYFGVKA